MPRIKRFKLKEGITLDDIRSKHPELKPGGSYVSSDAVGYLFKTLDEEVTVTIAFPDTESFFRWNDFDYILVLDEYIIQPYGPFYDHLSGRGEDFPFVNRVINEYNGYLSSLEFLAELEN